ncbi:MAG: transketolase [Candidatus Aminicenantaceae bacterium]
MDKKDILSQIAKRLRIHSIKSTTKAGSGHPSTCLSAAELVACLFFDEMRFNPEDPEDEANDEFVLSKGHAAPILWAAYAEAGIFPISDLMNLRKIDSNFEGHPTPRIKWVKAATGSLGQGLSVGVGISLAMKLRKSPGRTYVLMGDGECAEGAVWEAANAASLYKLDNLIAVVDINRLGQSNATMHEHDINVYERKFEAFGWDVVGVDGHTIPDILKAFKKANQSRKPVAILAKTIKGKGVSFIEDENGWHGKPLTGDDAKKALDELGDMPEIESRDYVSRPEKAVFPPLKKDTEFKRNDYKEGIATRRAYGNALVNLGKVNDAVIVLDGDVKNSTYAEFFMEEFPERSFQLYIAEQCIAGMGIGLASKGFIPFVATFSAFWSRAHDQIRMAAYSFSNIKFVGSHSGVSIGEDGPSQMGLEDLAMFRPIPDCVILYPSDAYSSEACVKTLAEHWGISYLRTTRPGTPILYEKEEHFPIGGSKVLRKSSEDRVCIIAAGITVHEALKAYEELIRENIKVCVVDAYSVQPLDRDGIIEEVKDAQSRAVVVEDHFKNGGLGDAVYSALGGSAEIIHLAVNDLPRSGKKDELMDLYGISATHIKKAVEDIIL